MLLRNCVRRHLMPLIYQKDRPILYHNRNINIHNLYSYSSSSNKIRFFSHQPTHQQIRFFSRHPETNEMLKQVTQKELHNTKIALRAERDKQIAAIKRRQYAIIAFLLGSLAFGYVGYNIILSVGNDRKMNKKKSYFEGKIKKADQMKTTKYKLEDVVGMYDAKMALYEALQLPLKLPHLFGAKGRKSWSGILLYGPPGTGKSMLAEAICADIGDISFLSCAASDIKSKWVGETERNIKAMFDTAKKNAPCVIFLDEVDAIVTSRNEEDSNHNRSMKNELLVQMQGMSSKSGVIVLAATNMPFGLDSAFRRRCQKRIYAGLPDVKEREQLLKIHLKNISNTLTEKNMSKIAHATKGFSGADISNLVKTAAMVPVLKLARAKCFCKFEYKPKNIETFKNQKLDWSKMIFECDCDYTKREYNEQYLFEEKNILKNIEDEVRDLLYPKPVSMSCFQEALAGTKKTVDPKTLLQFMEYRKEFGTS